MSVLWTEKYRPSKQEDYVFTNETFKEKMQEWISTGEIPHLGFFGPAGTGKTSAIKVLLTALSEAGHIDMFDVTTLNMSDEGMDAVRDKIDAAAQLGSIGKYRVFVLEEMEQMHRKAQGSLKRIMEDYHENARFILTSNEPHKIITPVRSRVQSYILEKHNMDQFMERICNILLAEGVDLSTDESIQLLQKYINSTYPDFRKTLNTLQSSIVNGQLKGMDDTVDNTSGYRLAIVDALKNGSIRQMREQIVANIPEDEIDSFFSYLYRNATMFSTDEIQLMKIKVKIRDAVVKQASVSDREMNLSALLCEIDLICAGEM